MIQVLSFSWGDSNPRGKPGRTSVWRFIYPGPVEESYLEERGSRVRACTILDRRNNINKGRQIWKCMFKEMQAVEWGMFKSCTPSRIYLRWCEVGISLYFFPCRWLIVPMPFSELSILSSLIKNNACFLYQIPLNIWVCFWILSCFIVFFLCT